MSNVSVFKYSLCTVYSSKEFIAIFIENIN
jgi:hypothetical protein